MDFEVKIVSLAEVSKHENADSLDIARIAGYQCVVRRNQFRTGDLAVYIPEGSIIPQELLEKTGLWDPENNKGKLAGPRGNRLKAVRLRGVVSQGLLVPAPQGLGAGDDVAEHYGITKYVPEVPAGMRGQVPRPPASPPPTTSRTSSSGRTSSGRGAASPTPRNCTAPWPATATSPGWRTRPSSTGTSSWPARG